MSTVRVRLTGDWERANAILQRHRSGTQLRHAIDRAIKREAEEFVRDVKQGVRQGSPGGKPLAPNRPLVVYRKRSNKPLIDHGDLVNSVRIKRIRQMEYFAGVHRTAKRRARRGTGGRFVSGGAGGASLADIAQVHEKGKIIVIRITPRMQRWFFADLMRAATASRRRRASGTRPAAGSRRSGGAVPSFRPGAILIIRLKPRPFLGPVFKRRRRGVEQRVMANLSRELHGDFGRVGP